MLPLQLENLTVLLLIVSLFCFYAIKTKNVFLIKKDFFIQRWLDKVFLTFIEILYNIFSKNKIFLFFEKIFVYNNFTVKLLITYELILYAIFAGIFMYETFIKSALYYFFFIL